MSTYSLLTCLWLKIAKLFKFFLTKAVSTQNETLEGLYKGCFTDKQSSRDLSGYHYEDNAALTIEKCMIACENSSARYFGVQFKYLI